MEGSTSAFSLCLRVSTDQDDDGISDFIEDSGPNAGDSNNDGSDDATQANVAHTSIGSSLGDVSIATEADSLRLEELISPFEAIDRADFRNLLDAQFQSRLPAFMMKSTLTLNSTPSGGTVLILQTPAGAQSTTLTLMLSQSLPVTSYFNFGPTPDNPEAHLYEFLFDETTGAELLEDRILVHFVDGQRGDHDLTVNGVIETLGGPVMDAGIFFFPQLADGVAGPVQFQSSLIFANSAGPTPVQVELFDSAGNVQGFTFGEEERSPVLQVELGAGESFSTQTPGTDPIQVGYAQVIAAEGVGGTAVFSRTDAATGTLLYEAGVAASESLTDFSLFVYTMGDRDTGLALAFPDVVRGDSAAQAGDTKVTLRLYDKSFNLIATAALQLAPGEHRARFIAELFEEQAALLAEFEGSLTVESDQPIVGVTLRQNDDPTRSFPEDVPALTTFPVIPGRADSDLLSTLSTQGTSQTEFFFPQVGDGTADTIQFQTAMIFVNTGLDSDVQADFFDSFGAPLSLDFGTGGSGSSLNFAMKSGEALAIQTPGTGGLQVGYARITAGSGVGGTAVFSRTHVPTGTLLYEAGVPAATALTDFSLVVDSLGVRDTGLALLNPPGSGTATITLRLYDQSFNLIDDETLLLAGGNHLPQFIKEFFREVEQASEMQGSLTVSSDVPLVAVTLRQNDDPAIAFPDEVPTLATFPVIPGRSDLLFAAGRGVGGTKR